jgi:hypothetical protein
VSISRPACKIVCRIPFEHVHYVYVFTLVYGWIYLLHGCPGQQSSDGLRYYLVCNLLILLLYQSPKPTSRLSDKIANARITLAPTCMESLLEPLSLETKVLVFAVQSGVLVTSIYAAGVPGEPPFSESSDKRLLTATCVCHQRDQRCMLLVFGHVRRTTTL